MEKRKLMILFFYILVVLAFAGIFVFYERGFTGNVISGRINDSFINLTKEIQLSEDLKKGVDGIVIKNMIQDFDGLEINYSFDNSGFIGNETSIDIWLVNESGIEVKRIRDIFAINREGVIDRNAIIGLGDIAEGNYIIYFAMTSDIENPVKQPLFVNKYSITGKTILDQPRNKWIGYVVFILIILAGIFFIIRGHGVENK